MPAKKLLLFSLIFLLASTTYNVCSASTEKIGVVLMHGKGGSPTEPELTGIINAMNAAGFIVKTPDMSYSKTRQYDKSYADTLTEVDTYVAQLRQSGATKVFIAGHSMGANVAIGYAAKTTVDGILAIAPGQTPEMANFQAYVGTSVSLAQQMVNAGNGNVRSTFTDVNQGVTSTITTTASIYLSWFSPTGPAVMPANAQAMKPGTAFMWVVGTQDSMYQNGASYAFNKAPSNNYSEYLVINSDHLNTPNDAKGEITRWIQGVGTASPLPFIYGNTISEQVSIKSTDQLSLSVNLLTGPGAAPGADWWVVATAPSAMYYLMLPAMWMWAANTGSIEPTYQGGIVPLPVSQILTLSGLPAGTYSFYFGVDSVQNGTIDTNSLYYDVLQVTVSN